uniref:Uncharacterized protein n=1 Tax=Oryza meridionalis TaxID=40149 RepID=A0A0E0EL68_9ORYZ
MSRRIAKSNGATIPTQLPGSSLTHRGIAPASIASIASAAVAFDPPRHRRPPHLVADPAPPSPSSPTASIIAVLPHRVADLAPRLIPPTPAPSPTAVLATAIAVLPHHVPDPALLSVDLHHGPFRATPEAARQSSGRRWLLSAGECKVQFSAVKNLPTDQGRGQGKGAAALQHISASR